MPQRVLVADDHQIVRQSVRALLESQGFEITGGAANGLEAVELAQAGGCDVAILDLSMPELDGIEAAREILATSPDTSAILLTVHAEEHIVFNALQAGIRGYVVKTQAAEELVRAIGKVSTGAIYLSPGVYGIVLDTYLSGATILEDPLARREREVLQLVAEGKSTKQIAAALNVRVKTIESYRTRIMDKLKIRTAAGLVRYAIRRGLITPWTAVYCANSRLDFTHLPSSAVTLMVHRAGETTLKVMAEGVSKELTVKARQENGVLHVEITQRKPATD